MKYTFEDTSGNCVEYGDLDETIAIVESAHPDCLIHEEWEPEGEGRQRRLVWADEATAENDDGAEAIGAIVREGAK